MWCEYIADILNTYDYKVNISVKTDWNTQNFPTAVEMERIRKNVQRLKGAYTSFTDMPADLDYMTIKKANDIEKILYEMDKILESMENDFIYSNVSNCGQVRIWQQRFRKLKIWNSQPYKLSQYADTDTLAMIATEKEVIFPNRTNGKNEFLISNKILNGSLRMNTDEWTISGNNSTNCDGEYTTIKLTSTATNGGTFPNYQYFDEISGNSADTKQIIYACANVRSRTTNTSYPRVYLSYYKNGSASVSYYNLTSTDGATEVLLNDEEWHKLSRRVTTYDTSGYSSYSRVAFGISNGVTVGDEMDIKDVLVINLTEIFGVGTEPSEAWCDENIQYSGFDFSLTMVSEKLNLVQIDKRDDVYESIMLLNESMQFLDDLVGCSLR